MTTGVLSPIEDPMFLSFSVPPCCLPASTHRAQDCDHTEVGRASYPFRKMMPAPYHKALQCLSQANGWSLEACHQALICMIPWLEHSETRLREFKEEKHTRPTNIPAFVGMAASDRKSSLKTFMTSTFLQVPELPAWMKNGQAVCNDGTLLGFRSAIEAYGRTGLVSDEISNSYETSQSERQQGVHYLGRPKMTTFARCERDLSLTGRGHIDLGTYTFLHYCMGQVPDSKSDSTSSSQKQPRPSSQTLQLKAPQPC